VEYLFECHRVTGLAFSQEFLAGFGQITHPSTSLIQLVEGEKEKFINLMRKNRGGIILPSFGEFREIWRVKRLQTSKGEA
jgi:hypothetical protein